jgi:2-oxoglutarate ferredoxin oxidoreductase subunit delta
LNSKQLIIEKSWCKGCSICIEYCPKKVLELKENTVDIIDIDRCIQCGQCELRCPDYAIYLKDFNK